MSTSGDNSSEDTTSDLPPLQSEASLSGHSQPPSVPDSQSPANPSSEDPITRSVMSGQLNTTNTADKEKPVSPVSHTRGGSTIRGGSGGPALSVLNLLRGRGQLALGADNDDEDDSDEEMGGMGASALANASPISGLGSGMGLMRPRGATADTLKKEVRDLHPYATMLGPRDAASCIQLENAVFPESQAASPDKVRYRIGTCGELSLGLFSSVGADGRAGGEDVVHSPTVETANRVESAFEGRRGVLLGAIIATKTRNFVIKDEDMMLPRGYSTDEEGVKNAEDVLEDMKDEQIVRGHDEAGRTIALHSLAVVPEYQKLGLGTILMKSYVQRIMEADVADRIAILTYQRLIPYYAKLGFENKGQSDATYGGGNWINMVLEFESMKKGDASGDEE